MIRQNENAKQSGDFERGEWNRRINRPSAKQGANGGYNLTHSARDLSVLMTAQFAGECRSLQAPE